MRHEAERGPNAPVVLFVYRRAEHLPDILDRIAAARPPRVYVFADAPRDREDRDATEAVQAIIAGWSPPFPVEVSVASRNLGNSARVESGIATVFETEEKAIFVEDDVALSAGFFGFCDRLLALYDGAPEVMMISGLNPLDTWPAKPAGADHLFSTLGNAQAWATWRRAWQRREGALDRWRRPDARARLAAFLLDDEMATARGALYDALDQGRETSWDYRWALARQLDHGLTAVPVRNLVRHLGHDVRATNLRRRALFYDLARLHEVGAGEGPCPPLLPDRAFDRILFEISHDRLSPASARQVAAQLMESGRRLLAVALLRHAGGAGDGDATSDVMVRDALTDVAGERP